MVAIIVENVAPRLRGRLAIQLLEVRAGVYVGRASARLRERIWGEVQLAVGEGNAVMVWSAPSEQGYRVATCGNNRREPVDLDGLWLVAFRPESGPDQPNATAGDGR